MTAAKKKEPLGLHAKLLLISEDLGFMSFDKKNTGQGYGYASAAGVIRKLQASLIKRGVTRRCINQQASVLAGDNNKGNLITVHSVWEWKNSESDESLHTSSVGQGKDPNDKGVGKAVTNSNKYDIANTLCLAWGAEDPEGSDPDPQPKKPKTNQKDVAKLIESATTLKELEAVKASVMELTGAVKKAAIEDYKAKKATFSA